LGDCLGKGAFGSVYRALNWNTGGTVAVKQIRLADLPKSELRVIMVCARRVRQHGVPTDPSTRRLQLEIDLLKNLDVSIRVIPEMTLAS
jgi:serine/threonine protein kinase